MKDLKEIFKYNPDDGTFQRFYAGKYRNAGFKETKGYICVRPFKKGKSILAHRLAFYLMTGEWPKGQVDHIDCDPTNNKWSNLRDVTPSENQKNLKMHKNGRPVGVTFHKITGKWQAVAPCRWINRNEKITKYLGLFNTMEEAGNAVYEFCKGPL